MVWNFDKSPLGLIEVKKGCPFWWPYCFLLFREMLQEGEKRSSNISHSLHPFNPLLLDYCSWYGFRLQPFAVKNSSSDVFHLDFGLLHSHWSLNVNRDILCRKSVKLNSVNRWKAPEFRFHCILMVLELNLVIHWSNTCFVDLLNTQRNVGSALDMLPIFASTWLVHLP